MSPSVKISAALGLLIVIGVVAWFMVSSPEMDQPSHGIATEEGVVNETSGESAGNAGSAAQALPVEQPAVVAAPEPVTPDMIEGSFAARCEREMNDYAIKRNTNPKTYLEANRDAYRRCIDGYISDSAKTNLPNSETQNPVTEEPQTQPVSNE